ncbi:hypothetical protein GJ496_008590 [Pomphorhynchus laevis]|nr:hypothetical protein GJ496_008590 [Pomphorhynchus laevis]
MRRSIRPIRKCVASVPIHELENKVHEESIIKANQYCQHQNSINFALCSYLLARAINSDQDDNFLLSNCLERDGVNFTKKLIKIEAFQAEEYRLAGLIRQKQYQLKRLKSEKRLLFQKLKQIIKKDKAFIV